MFERRKHKAMNICVAGFLTPSRTVHMEKIQIQAPSNQGHIPILYFSIELALGGLQCPGRRGRLLEHWRLGSGTKPRAPVHTPPAVARCHVCGRAVMEHPVRSRAAGSGRHLHS